MRRGASHLDSCSHLGMEQLIDERGRTGPEQRASCATTARTLQLTARERAHYAAFSTSERPKSAFARLVSPLPHLKIGQHQIGLGWCGRGRGH
jgi:hypothetical protein